MTKSIVDDSHSQTKAKTSSTYVIHTDYNFQVFSKYYRDRVSIRSICTYECHYDPYLRNIS